jgi:hypothetical protein
LMIGGSPPYRYSSFGRTLLEDAKALMDHLDLHISAKSRCQQMMLISKPADGALTSENSICWPADIVLNIIWTLSLRHHQFSDWRWLVSIPKCALCGENRRGFR